MSFAWSKDPIKQIDKLKKGLQNKAIRIALNKSASPVKAKFVERVPVQSGALRSSIRIRLRQYKSKTIWSTIVGPKSSFTKNVKVTTIRVKGQKPKRKLRRPSKYYPLLNRGTKYIAARHITESILATVRQSFPQNMCASLRQQIAQLLAGK